MSAMIAAVPSTSSTSRGSHVGSACGANAACAARRYAPTSPPAPPAPTIFITKSIGNATRPRATAAIGTTTIATEIATANAISRGRTRQR